MKILTTWLFAFFLMAGLSDAESTTCSEEIYLKVKDDKRITLLGCRGYSVSHENIDYDHLIVDEHTRVLIEVVDDYISRAKDCSLWIIGITDRQTGVHVTISRLWSGDNPPDNLDKRPVLKKTWEILERGNCYNNMRNNWVYIKTLSATEIRILYLGDAAFSLTRAGNARTR